jgi:decaprenyl-phosphate phosphoribosyltransferase
MTEDKQSFKDNLKDYSRVFRPTHWFKNLFMLIGSAAAVIIFNGEISLENIKLTVIAFICTSIAASANYGINELLDSEYDKFHPSKKDRPLASGRISRKSVLIVSIALAAASGVLSFFFLPRGAFYAVISLMVMGFFYNVKPFRTKELPYLDVISESVNNPIRFIIGWYAVQITFFPPASFLIALWAFGAFLMACKRLAEYRFIDNPVLAAQYRNSFKHYTQEKLIVSIIAYVSMVSFSVAVICIKYDISIILAVPIFIAAIVWYFHLTLKKDSPAKEPEKLLKHKEFYIFTVLTILIFILAKILNPRLEFLLRIWG